MTSDFSISNTSTSPQKAGLLSERLLWIDILRALAVILVFGRHIMLSPESGPFVGAIKLWQQGGWVGVDLFFVLSGFLVSGLLFKEYRSTKTINPVRFLIRRGFKIYPVFWLLIVVTLFLNWIRSIPFSWQTFFCEFFFIQNYFNYRWWPHTWSLAVEEHFYVGLSIVIFIWVKLKAPQIFIPLFCSILMFGCLILRLSRPENFRFDVVAHCFPTHLRIDALACGCLLAWWNDRNQSAFVNFSNKYKWLLLILGLCGLSLPFWASLESSYHMQTYGLTLCYLGSAAWVFIAASTKRNENASFPLIGKALAYIGTYSYSIYVWHIPVNIWFALWAVRHLHLSAWTYLLIYGFLTLTFGILISKWIEYPVLKLRNHYFPSMVK